MTRATLHTGIVASLALTFLCIKSSSAGTISVFGATPEQEQQRPVLGSLLALDELIGSDQTFERVGNVDVYSNMAGDGGDDNIAVCRLSQIFPFSTYTGELDLEFYTGAAAVALAAQHLNEGDGSIAPIVSGLNERCNIRFTTDSYNSEGSEAVAIDKVIQLTDTRQRRLPCALLGSARSAVSSPTSIISSLRGYPQISPASTSDALNEKSQHPLFGRTIPSDDGTAIPLVLYFRNVLNVRYLAVLHVADSYGNSFAKGIQTAAEQLTPDLQIFTASINHQTNSESITNAIEFLKRTEYRYFFCITSSNTHDDIMTKAYEAGIAGTGRHNWFFSESLLWPIGRPFEVGSPLEKAYRGTGLISAIGGTTDAKSFDTKAFGDLVKALGSLKNEKDLASLRSTFPIGLDHETIINSESFLRVVGVYTPFLYDAVIGLGLSACEAASKTNNTYFDGKQHFETFAAQTFEGSSGFVRFDVETGSRDPNTALFSVLNFVDDPERSHDGIVEFKGVTAGIFRSGEYYEEVPYVFNSGTTSAPRDLPEVETNYNYLPTGLKAIGLILCAIIVGLSLAFSIWTRAKQDIRVVRASQPIFLQIIVLGTAIMGLSIIPLSIDQGAGADAACMAFPWLAVLGFSFTFSALFTKTHRVNKIAKCAKSFRRLTVTAMDVAKPMIALLLSNTIILACWTALYPRERTTIILSEDLFGQVTEAYTVCDSEEDTPFWLALMVINIGAVAYSIFEAYQARNIHTELSESEWIFKALVLIILVCFIGIPIMILSKDNPSALYFVVTGIITVVCCSILLLIFVPKIMASRKKPETQQERPRLPTLPRTASQESFDTANTANAGGMRISAKATPAMVASLKRENEELKKKLLRKSNQEDITQDDQSKLYKANACGMKVSMKPNPTMVASLELENEELKKKLQEDIVEDEEMVPPSQDITQSGQAERRRSSVASALTICSGESGEIPTKSAC